MGVMGKMGGKRMKKIIPMMAVVFVIVANAHAQVLRAEPELVEFHAQTDSGLVALYLGNTPYPASKMQGWRFMVDDNFYNHMIKVEVEDERLRIRPSAELEVGQYTLHVSTPAGEVAIMVRAPLDEDENVVDRLAAQSGISKEMAQKKLGLSDTIGEAKFEFQIPESFHLGKTLKLETSGPAETKCVWKLDGEVVLEGENERKFKREFWEVGEYQLEYTETVNGETTAEGKATVKVVEPTPIPMQAPVGVKISIIGPEGYAKYSWILDGKLISEARTLEYKFDAPGPYSLISKATEPMDDGKFDNSYNHYQVDAQKKYKQVKFGTAIESK